MSKYDPLGELDAGGTVNDVFEKFVVEVYLGNYLGTFLELLEQGYCLHMLLRYYRLKGCYAYERVLVGIAAAIGIFCSVIHIGLMISFVRDDLGDLNSLGKVHWELKLTSISGGAVLCIVQALYAHRMSLIVARGYPRLCVRIGLGLAILLCLLCALAAQLAYIRMPQFSSVLDPNIHKLDAYFRRISPIVLASFAGNIAVDLIISIGTVWAMRETTHGRLRTSETMKAVSRYILISLQCTLLPALCSIIGIGLHVYKISGSYDAIALFSISKLALISILHMFVTRGHMARKLRTTGLITEIHVHVTTEVVYSEACDYPLERRRHAGLRPASPAEDLQVTIMPYSGGHDYSCTTMDSPCSRKSSPTREIGDTKI